MTPEQIADLVKQIQTGMVWAQWPTYLLAIALIVVFVYFSSRLSAFASKTGEIEAITTKFDQLTAQLKANTETVESVRTEIAHGDWVAREWKTLRRQKLEQLLENVLATKEWQEAYRSETVFQSKISAGVSPVAQIELIGLLYFPELRDCIFSFCQTHTEIYVLTLKCGQGLIKPVGMFDLAFKNSDIPEMKRSSEEAQELRAQYFKEHLPIHTRQLVAKSQLEHAARDIFLSIVGAGK